MPGLSSGNHLNCKPTCGTHFLQWSGCARPGSPLTSRSTFRATLSSGKTANRAVVEVSSLPSETCCTAPRFPFPSGRVGAWRSLLPGLASGEVGHRGSSPEAPSWLPAPLENKILRVAALQGGRPRPSSDISTLPLEDAASSFHQTLETAGAAAFHLATRRTPRRPGKPWWNDDCARAVLARRRAWNQWRRTTTILAGTNYPPSQRLQRQDHPQGPEECLGFPLLLLSFSSSTKRTWDFLHSMEGRKAHHPIPLTDGAQSLLDDPEKAEALARHYHQKIELPPTLLLLRTSPSHLYLHRLPWSS
ncbi:hypothetical protein GWK47_023372 [Chionoecetes opilio]|uniref:Uncharacterized protein n=1 Tax=Chionoecetes opilio TaxID=41210 RepID=A0A8J5CEM2_CHIOP|nr:hypothetical protein GWK47_023372 [Chionoecetes opilio]